jgi:cystathionine beta-synthase
MVELIGNTELLRDTHLSNRYSTTILIKAEYQNPGKSAKDRPALYMIRDAERRGLLCDGYTVVDASSGNTATGLAILCRQLGYSSHFFLSKNASEEKRTQLLALGAQVTICATSGGPDDPGSTINRAKEWCAHHPKSYFCNQYFNPSNQLSHYETTGPEIWEQTNGKITHFICGVGTGGTISGVAHYLKEKDPTITVIGVDSVGSILYDYFYKGSFDVDSSRSCEIEGIGRTFVPGSLDMSFIDEFIQVSLDSAVQAVYDYIEHGAVLPGFSSGAVLAALHQMAPGLRDTDQVVLLFADHGCKYYSKLYNEAWLVRNGYDRYKSVVDTSLLTL